MCAEQEVVLRVEGISKQLGGRPILDNCSLTVRRGELKVLIGPSGAGKSTLLQCIDCLIPRIPVKSGWRANALEMRDKRKLCAFRAQVGMIFQDFNLFDHLTAEENVAIALRKVRGMSRRDAKARALEELGRVGLARRAPALPRPSFRAARSSALPSHGPWPWTLKLFCWTSPLRPWTRSWWAKCWP